MKSKVGGSLLLLITIFSLQLLVYRTVLFSYVNSWGATEEEISMSLPGDEVAPAVYSTRAIAINASREKVWQWIIQLGADRGGFFSYAFIEKALGYFSNNPAIAVEKYHDMPVGRLVPGTLEDKAGVIDYNFPVVAVEPGQWYILENWGTFFLREIAQSQTRLIVRTHSQDTKNLMSAIMEFIGMSLHYLMERRMLTGIKSWVETGKSPAALVDMLWLAGIMLSGAGFLMVAFIKSGIAWNCYSVIVSIGWLWPLLVLPPDPQYSLGYLVLAIFGFLVMNRRKIN